MIESLWSRLLKSFRDRKGIDTLLAAAPEVAAPLKVRIHWFFDLIEWVRREGVLKNDFDFESGAPQAARIRYFLQLLDRNEEWKKNVARLLRSIIRDTKGMELFIQTGLFSEDYFWAELTSRLSEKILPQVPEEEELSYIFSQNFRHQSDIEWIRLLDHKTLSRIIELFSYETTAADKGWNSLRVDMEQALLLLALQIQGMGLATDIRKRLSRFHFQQLPFYELPHLIEKFITEPDSDMKRVLGLKAEKKLDDCKLALAEVHHHLEGQGVSTQIVFKIERLEHLIRRVHDLLYLILYHPVDPNMLSQFIENLVSENIHRKSVSALLSQNFSLLSRRIVERAAETGEHYIARTKEEYIKMIRSAFGGGVITAFTNMVKFLVYTLNLTSFYNGVLAGFNYSASFLFIHFLGYTLGTKQPAMTAPALAEKMNGDLSELVDEIVHLIRSQAAAIFGNVMGVIPVTFIVCWIQFQIRQTHLISEEKALHVIHDFSILGPTPFYAAFTGILLWVSSVFSGWLDNWFVLHQISKALAANRRMNFIFGPAKARAISLFLRHNVLGIAASISLGFLLGLTPALLQFIGINLDVRHVTLSSGALTLAVASLPMEALKTADFWLAVGGVASMGVLNVSVAFGFALFLAVRGKHVHAPQRNVIYRAVVKRLIKKPLSFIWPKS